MECRGTGFCLQQMENGNYQKGYGKDCQYQCEPLDCPNFVICNVNGPKWYLDCHNGFCGNCSAIFGCKVKISNIENEECAICFEEIDQVAQFPKCIHYVCIGCYKRIYFGEDQYYDTEDSDDKYEIIEPQNIKDCPLCRSDLEHNKWWKK